MNSMLSRLASLLAMFVSFVVVSAGIGVVIVHFMTVGLERDVQMALGDTVPLVAAIIGAPIGLIIRYGILRRAPAFSDFCMITSATTVSGAGAALVLHMLTDTGGWLSMFVAIVVALATSVVLKSRVAPVGG